MCQYCVLLGHLCIVWIFFCVLFIQIILDKSQVTFNYSSVSFAYIKRPMYFSSDYVSDFLYSSLYQEVFLLH